MEKEKQNNFKGSQLQSSVEVKNNKPPKITAGICFFAGIFILFHKL